VTKLDLLRAFRFTDDHMFPPYEQVMAEPVRQVMTTDATTVTPRTPLTRVLETLVRTRMKSLPVVEDERVVGMIAREDVLAALRRAVAGERATGPL
jgi:CBS domain-containing protein